MPGAFSSWDEICVFRPASWRLEPGEKLRCVALWRGRVCLRSSVYRSSDKGTLLPAAVISFL